MIGRREGHAGVFGLGKRGWRVAWVFWKFNCKCTSSAPAKDDIQYKYAWYVDNDLNWDGFVVIVCACVIKPVPSKHRFGSSLAPGGVWLKRSTNCLAFGSATPGSRKPFAQDILASVTLQLQSS